MFFTEEKLAKQVEEMEEYRYRDTIPIPSFRCKTDQAGAVGEYPDDSGQWGEFRTGDRWRSLDQYLWLAADVLVPAEWRGRRIVGRFRFGETIGGNIGGFESLLFVEGSPYQGVDTNHEEVLFPGERAGTVLALRFRLWSGLNGYGRREELEHRFQLAELSWLDEHADDLFYTGKAILETVELLPDNSPDRAELLEALNKAFRRLDWSRPGSDSFYASVAEACVYLRERLSRMPKRHPVTVHCIGHTHIDVAWLWRLTHTREKAARSFSTVLRLMEEFPDYVFLQTQPQLYEYIKRDYPELYGRIKERVREGRWEAGGAMWLEADCNLTSGESLVRQIMYGKRFFREEFGVDCRYLWLPDVFGYSWALPQILAQAGIDMFMTTKISWNQYNRMPHDTFYWRGIDGTKVLTHFITTPDPVKDIGAFYYTYNGKVTPHSVLGIWEGYRDKALNKELLLAYGYGDGGGGVNREMLELRRRLDELPGIPRVRTGRADVYFEGLVKRVSESEEYVHTWDGELYLELHRGTYTSQAYVKKMNRRLELLYREAEWLGVLGSLLKSDWAVYDSAKLLEGWKIILRNQFHDIIPGSSIHEVYEDCRVEYAEAEAIGLEQWYRGAEAVLGAESVLAQSAVGTGGPAGEAPTAAAVTTETVGAAPVAFTVFNSAPWCRSELARLPVMPGMEAGSWTDGAGRRLEAQREAEGWLVKLESVPAMGFGTVSYKAGAGDALPEEGPFRFHGDGISTPYYEIRWNPQGQLCRIYDKAADREVLADGEAGNVLQVFEDKPKSRHEAWDIDLYYLEKMRVIDSLKQVTVVETGPLRAAIRFEWTYRDSAVSQELAVYAGSRRIDFVTKVDWQEQRQLLKVAFPVQVRSTEATFDIQFGNVKRPTHWNTSWDYAKFETVGHQWADLSERGYGVSLLNDCKYGYDIKDHVMRLTLLKSALVPDPQQDQGEHRFTYSLLPHTGDWFEGRTVQEAWAINNPIRFAAGSPAVPEFALFRFSANHVMADAVKKSEDHELVVLRIHEYAGLRGDVDVSCGLPVQWWQECNLLEEPLGERREGAGIRLQLKPYEIRTVLVRFG